MSDANPGLMAIFGDALEVPDPAARAAYLDRVCGDNAALRQRVEVLLAAHAGAGRFLELDSAGLPDDPTHLAPDATGEFSPDPYPPTETVAGTRAPDDPAGGVGNTPRAEPGPGVGAGTVIAGRYTLLEVIGEGGMGAVYLASQSEPVKRQVALKLIKSGLDSKAVQARFDAERQALAVMDHPNIARVYDGGATAAGQPFFVMELVQGVSLTLYCDRHRLSVKARLELFIQVCQAVQHAHQKGIIHRDLKPGNVLVTEVDGRPTPKVIDFGVAKATELRLTDLSFADVGTIVGTPAYMSPEQADPSSTDIDTRTDVYALGVMLYELLAGSPPLDTRQFKQGAVLEMLRMVREVDPPRPSTRLSKANDLPNIAARRSIEPARLAKSLRGELDWVVMKALEKDRTRRYDTANGLARDLQRYLADEVVEARPPSAGYRVKKFVRRHKGQVIAAGLVLFVLLTGVIGTTGGLIEVRRQEQIARAETAAKVQALQAEAERVKERDDALGTARKNAAAARAEAVRANDQKRRAEQNLTKAEKAEKDAREQRNRADNAAEVARQNLYYAQMHLGQQAWREHRGLPHMRQLLNNWVPTDAAPDRRGWEWFYLHALPYQNLRTLTESGRKRRPATVAWHLASKRLAEGAADGSIRIWDVDRERTTLVLKAPAPRLQYWGGNWLGWSPDGGKLAAGCRDGTVQVWDTGSGRKLQVLRGQQSPVASVAFCSDGTRVAAWGLRGTINIWDASTGRLTANLAHPGAVGAGAWSPDDKLLAAGHGDGTVTVSGTRAGDPIVTLRAHVAAVTSLAWSPDSSRLASTSQDFTAKIWEVASGRMVLGPLRHSHEVTSVAWEPEGQRLATGSIDETVKIWDATTGHDVLTLRGHVWTVTSLSWGPDGRLASGSSDGSVNLWNTNREQESSVLSGHVARATAVSWSPDGKRLGSGGDDGTIRIWDPVTHAEVLVLKGHDKGRRIPQFGLIRALAWSPDGTHLASAGLDGAAKVWEVASGREVFALPADRGVVWSVAWSRDGTYLAAGSQDGWVHVIEGLEHTPKVQGFKAHEPGKRGTAQPGVRALAWSPRENYLASAGMDGLVKIWDPIRGDERARLHGHQTPWLLSVAWSPDGRRLASAGTDRLVIAWDVESGQQLSTMRGHTDWVEAVVWSPDGMRLASAGLDDSVRVWDPRTGEETFVLRGRSGTFHDVSWNPDGAQLAAASSDGQVWLWDATRGFERDTTARALPYIDRKVASGTARGEDLLWFVESYLRAGKHKEALVAAKDDPSNLSKVARCFAEQGNAALADEVRTRARTRLEQQMAAEPDNATPAAELADLLLTDTTPWTVLKPTAMKSRGGATLTLQGDGSILASGNNVSGDVYRIDAAVALDQIAAVRLEALPDPSLPRNGPGRHASGNFHLSAFRLHLPKIDGESELTPLPVEHAWASFGYNASNGDITGTVDARLNRFWHVWGRVGEAHQAVFRLKEVATMGPGHAIIIELRHRDVLPANLGCFRLSVSGDPAAFARDRQGSAALRLTDPWARLAAAYQIRGDRQAFDRLLEQHPSAAACIGDLYAAAQDWERAIAAYRQALTDQPADGVLSSKLARAYEAAGRTREAVPNLATASTADPKDTHLPLKVAALQAWFRQDDELAATRQRILASAGGTTDTFTAERAAKVCSLAPTATRSELEAALALARRAVQVGKGGEWYLLSLGMAEYRSGNDKAAEEALLAAAKAGPNNRHVTGTAAFYRAMSLFRQGKADEARKLATEAAARMKPLPRDENNPFAGDADHDDLILWLAYKEARALIQFDPSSPPKAENDKK
jgi:WD40 repeat protein/tetratricopeptide (TPR) repeat protein/tRNA A-37 threonylcarbamoyl transferase component Bud32